MQLSFVVSCRLSTDGGYAPACVLPLCPSMHAMARVCPFPLAQEFMDESMLRLAKVAGWHGADILQKSRDLEANSTAAKGVRVNATPKPDVPLEVRQAIEHANSLDMQLYRYGVQLFLRQGDNFSTT